MLYIVIQIARLITHLHCNCLRQRHAANAECQDESCDSMNRPKIAVCQWIRVSAKRPVWTAFSFDPMPITVRSTFRRISGPLAEWWRCHLPTGILPVLLPWMRWCLTDLAFAPENKLSTNLGCCGGTARPQVHVSVWWSFVSSCRQNVWKNRVQA